MKQSNKIEVYILSGFLGSGKTSLLKHMVKIQKEFGKTPAVLMNELGQVSIDSNEVDKDTPLAELLDGCICCTIQDKLESQLQGLLINEKFDVLLVETTGAAHPIEVVDAIMSPLFADRFEFKGIITVVDAHQWMTRKELSPQVLQLLREQIRYAGLILLNKVNLLSEMQLATASSELQGINSTSQIIMTNHSSISANALTQISKVEKAEDYSRLNVIKHLRIQAIVHTFNKAIDQGLFEDWIRTLPETVYRMKGYIPFSHSNYPVLFQYSFGMPFYLPEDMKLPTNLVVIGEGLDKNAIIKDLRKLEECKKGEII
ncbi:CobW family GTP-binding protein [Jeotgalibacillus soli]|uniref:Cobalamin biosynthesis protein n=1 Tax=Jeotgalibacillus soli TaxID=889306 RepID=A0A0C2VJE8_9BACL|nr:GTP-binding protein [Jeotgalibacillus soli]KIL44118.1 cobalamin biosynthesis protein [Jeotgalibacillus soli]